MEPFFLFLVMKCSGILLSVLCEIIISLVGGIVISIDKAPYMVWVADRLKHDEVFGSGKICAGSIVSLRIILTAAHCYTVKHTVPNQNLGTNQFIVVAGTTTGYKAEESTKTYLIEHIAVHEDYNALTYDNDIALVFINDFRAMNSKNIQAVALPDRPPIVGDVCLVYGWGLTNKTQFPVVLQESPLIIWNYEDCVLKYPGMVEFGICAGALEGSHNPCHTGLGGALICSNKLYGILSWGVDCVISDIPNIFTNIYYQIPWIEVTTFENSKITLQSSDGSQRNFNLQVIWFIVINYFLL